MSTRPSQATASDARLRTLIGVAAATIAAALVHLLATAVFDLTFTVPAGADAEMDLGLFPVILVALVSSLAGWLAASLLARFSGPARTIWTVLAGLVFVLSLLPVVSIGLGSAEMLALGLMHAVVFVAVVLAIRPTLPERG